MDLGFVRALGLGALSLWTLVRLWRQLGLVAGTCVRRLPSDLGAGVRFLLRIWRGRLERWNRLRRRIRQCGLAAVRAGRSVLPVVWARGEPRERGQHL